MMQPPSASLISDFLFHYLNDLRGPIRTALWLSLAADRLMVIAAIQEEPTQFANDYLNSGEGSKEGEPC